MDSEKTQVTELGDENIVTTIKIVFQVVKMWKKVRQVTQRVKRYKGLKCNEIDKNNPQTPKLTN